MSWRGAISNAIRWLLPASCVGCGGLGAAICETCLGTIEFAPKLLPSPSDCDAVTGYVDYCGVIKSAITIGKFNGERALFAPIAERLARIMPYVAQEGDLFMSVPIHDKRRKVRGFNQVDLLFGPTVIGGGGVLTQGLVRLSNTTPLFECSPEERARIMEGQIAVQVPESVKGRRVVLFDDILTTGTTLETAASALKAAGATQVSAHVLCYSKPHEKGADH